MTQVEQLLVRMWGTPEMSFRGWTEIRAQLRAMVTLATALEQWDAVWALMVAMEVAGGMIDLSRDEEYRAKTEAA